MRKTWILFGLLVAGLIAGWVLVRRPRPAPVPVALTKPAPVPQAAAQSMARPVDAPAPSAAIEGRVEARTTIDLHAPADGLVREIFVEPGQAVTEAQLLARIGNSAASGDVEALERDARLADEKARSLELAVPTQKAEAARAKADAARARAQAEIARRTFQRMQGLNAAGALARKDFDRAQLDFDLAQKTAADADEFARESENRVYQLQDDANAARKALAQKTAALERTHLAQATGEVHAPAQGLITERLTAVGQMASARSPEPLFRMTTAPLSLQVRFAAAARMKTGDAVTLIFGDVPVPPLTAAIKKLENGSAVAEFDSPDPRIRPGMSCGVRPLE